MYVKNMFKRIGLYALVIVIVVYALFPFYYAVVSSIRSSNALFNVSLWPTSLTIQNYIAVFVSNNLGINLVNSVIVATVVVVLSLALALTSAFALSRVRFRGRGFLLMTILAVSMFPQVAVLSGLFSIINLLGLYDNLSSLVLSYLIFTLPFTVWVLTAFMRDVPKELEEAAIMDGAGPVRTLVKVFVPIMAPAMVTTGLLAFIAAWNEFLFALTFTLSQNERTVPVAIALFSGSSQYQIPWGLIMAASVVVTVPLVVLVLIFQRKIVSGLTLGAVKG